MSATPSQPTATKTIWVTRDGQRIRVRAMSDSHLVNTIKMLRRHIVEQQAGMPYPNFNGEMAQFYAEREWDHFVDADPDEILSEECVTFDALVDEAHRRKLEVD